MKTFNIIFLLTLLTSLANAQSVDRIGDVKSNYEKQRNPAIKDIKVVNPSKTSTIIRQRNPDLKDDKVVVPLKTSTITRQRNPVIEKRQGNDSINDFKQ